MALSHEGEYGTPTEWENHSLAQSSRPHFLVLRPAEDWKTLNVTARYHRTTPLK